MCRFTKSIIHNLITLDLDIRAHEGCRSLQFSTGIFLFRQDLRLTDNFAFQQLSERCERMLCVYVIQDDWLAPNRYGCQSLGTHRQRFLAQSLHDLNLRLQKEAQCLLVKKGDVLSILGELFTATQPDIIALNQHCGWNEQVTEKQITQLCVTHQVELILSPEASLIDPQQMPFKVQQVPNVFSPFRRKVEKSNYLRSPLPIPSAIPPKLLDFDYASGVDLSIALGVDQLPAPSHSLARFIGGETCAMRQLDFYLFDSDLIANYKHTRNQMDGWEFSSKLSAWLANGCISPATVSSKIAQYEKSVLANESTYWLIFELLWREFFHLQAFKQGKKLFSLRGIQNNQPSFVHDQQRFRQWCDGKTGYPIVDASMRQLNATGFMSNRGRQLVASCFVHELNLQWRYGAAYFEQQLIDYDVASNWGNWQYLAGVGSDPRGHRQFNLAKQTEIYDPNQDFIKQWLVSDTDDNEQCN